MESAYHKTEQRKESNQEVLTIPELEELRGTAVNRFWIEKDLAILEKYYGDVSVEGLAKYLGRTKYSVQCKASALGLTYGG